MMISTRVIQQIGEVSREAWNQLLPDNNPFIKHEFLSALERHHCVGKGSGWLPQHIVAYDDENNLIGAMPLYLKYHSYGEFVFDWAWAEAYERAGLHYYPKLVSAIPFTPINGPRLLHQQSPIETSAEEICTALIKAAIEHATTHGLSSIHCLFPNADQKDFYLQHNFIPRLGFQYHWHNHEYKSFDDYLSYFASRKRKNIIKERRQVKEQGVSFRILHGNEITHEEWRLFHHYYCAIYDRKWGQPNLTLGFFEEIARTLPQQIVMVLAYQNNHCIAAALNLRSDDTLYGRHWGCQNHVHNLHFETCYYQGLEYCIKHGLKHFEPGAQGEHKISRGFLPTPTWSAHWITHPEFRKAIQQFTKMEMLENEQLIKRLGEHSPFAK